MIYFFYGKNTKALRTKLHVFIDVLLGKKPDASVVFIDKNSWSEEKFENLIEAQGLFSEKNIIVLDSLFEEKEIEPALTRTLSSLKQSKNIFVIIEKAPSSVLRSRIEKSSEKTQFFDISDEKDEKKPNVFSLTDAVSQGDRRKAWVLYEKFIRQGVSAEEIHGALFWQIKALSLSLTSKTAVEAGLHPFVFSKSKTAAVKQGKQKTEEMLSSLVRMYHESRRGGEGLEDALELFILEY
ncbi:MAG: hypothetical protein U1D31_02550 [Patescibacteria group bacterium]|nr:hypothetical protein [bacterium]MDZ4240978.1 hypothetical protein [Patescibacteria group bacterium]